MDEERTPDEFESAPDEPTYEVVTGELPVCDYTGDPTDEPCEEPAIVKRWSSAAVITAAAIGSVVGGLLVAFVVMWVLGAWPDVRPVTQADVLPSDVNVMASDSVNTAVAVASKVTPSVVNVALEQRLYDPFTGATRLVEAGNGSGVIIREDGYILTNNHVIEGAARIVVTVGVIDVEAEVVGTDPSTDLAVLKISGTDHPAVDIGSSGDLEVGQFVVAVGSPFGLEKTVTTGIISALQRTSLAESATDITAYTNLIQTDAAINPGNSGGALVDELGELIGVNTLIQSPSGSVGAPQSAGIGFAIPVDLAMSVAEQLIETGVAIHPYVGLRAVTVDEALASQFGLPISRGALVQLVEPGSPAEDGGLKRGDIVTSIGGQDIGTFEDVYSAVRASDVGETVEVIVLRADTRRVLDVTLGSDAMRP